MVKPTKFPFVLFFLIAALIMAQRCAAQDALISSPAGEPALETALHLPAPVTPLYAPVTNPSPERQISWRRLVPNMVQDQKQIFLFPVSVARGNHLKPFLAITALTAGFVAIDEHNAKYFRNTQSFNGFNKVASGSNTSLAMEIFPAAFYAIGLARKDTYAQHTVLLAGEAVPGSQSFSSVMKGIDRPIPPSSVPPNGDFLTSCFKETSRGNLGSG